MKPIRLQLGRPLVFAGAFLFALLALLPLRLAIGWLGLETRGLAAREAQGSIWLGSLSQAQFGTIPLGDVQARLQALPLFVGRARVDLETDTEQGLRGAVTTTRHGFGIDDATGRVGLSALSSSLPLQRLDLDDLSVRFTDRQCVHAEGTVTAVAAGELAVALAPAGFTGAARCEGNVLLLPLASQTRAETLNIRLAGDGGYQAELAIRPPNLATAERLSAAGFAASGDLFILRRAGKL